MRNGDGMALSIRRIGVLLGLCLALIGCAETQLAAHVASVARPEPARGSYKIGKPYTIRGIRYTPREDMAYDRKGIASWYGPGFHGKQTANGEIFDANSLTAAHPTLQLPSIVRVTNLENGRSVVLRVNDRGPFANNRLIDISKRGAELLGFRRNGTAMVRVQLLQEETLAAIPPKEAARLRTVAVMNQQNTPPAAEPRPLAAPPPTVIAASVPAPGVQVASLSAPTAASLMPARPAQVQQAAPAQQWGGNPVFTAMPYPVHRPGPGPNTAPARVAPSQAVPGQAAPVQTQVAGRGATPRWYVQTGAFSRYDNAKRLGTQLTSLGRVEIQALDQAGGPIYMVRMGPLPSQDSAMELAQAVGSAGINDTRVMVD